MTTNKTKTGLVVVFSALVMLGALVGFPTVAFAQYAPPPYYGQPMPPQRCDMEVVAPELGHRRLTPFGAQVLGRSGDTVSVRVFCPAGSFISFSYGQSTDPWYSDGPNRISDGRLVLLSPNMPPLQITTGTGQSFTVVFNVTEGFAPWSAVNTANNTANQAMGAVNQATVDTNGRHLALALGVLLPVDGEERIGMRINVDGRFRLPKDIFRPLVGINLDVHAWQPQKSSTIPNPDTDPNFNKTSAYTLGFFAHAGLVIDLTYVELRAAGLIGGWFNIYPEGVLSQTMNKSNFYGGPIHLNVWAGGVDAGLALKHPAIPWGAILFAYKGTGDIQRIYVKRGMQSDDTMGRLWHNDLWLALQVMPR